LAPRSNLRTRVISALVLAPPVLAAVWLGGWVFTALVLAVAVLGVREWIRLVAPAAGIALQLAAYAAVAAVLAAWLVRQDAAALLVVAAAATLLLWVLARGVASIYPVSVAFVVAYIGLSCVAMLYLRNGTGPHGLGLFAFLLLVIWATDIGAYAAGRSIGGPKLAPRVSPKKTWAGLGGGVAGAALVGWAAAALFAAAMPAVMALVGALLAVVGQMGDLLESYVKRRSDVKDSGDLIPGHGGLLDRIDGLIAAGPVLAVFHGLTHEALSWW
jgi:phosphatidate cytidylyltransferase